MSKRNDPSVLLPALTPVRAVVAVMLLAPLMAWSVVTTVATQPEPASAPAALPGFAAGAANAGKPAGDYQIRCWQYGRLLFEENHVSMKDGRDNGLRLSGTDRNGRPVYVAETQNATCLVRPEAEPRGAPINGLR